jgi:4-alpha-glucanotransferase
MKVMEFAFDSRDASGSEYLPHNYIPNCVAYAGTHDNDTILGWFAEASAEDTAYCREYLAISEGQEANWSMMCALWSSVADLTIVQAQDILGLGSEARMNEPSTVGNNWRWRAVSGVFTKELAQKLRRKMKIYGRLP